MASETIVVSETFGPTIQGEGAVLGKPTVFVRTGGCDYRCSWSVTPDTPILLADLIDVPAGQIRAGHEILGQERGKGNPVEVARGPYRHGRVSAAIRTPDVDTVVVRFEDGREQRVTPDHGFVLYGQRVGGRMKAAVDLEPGDKIKAFSPYERQPENRDYRAGYLAGAADGDGSFRTFKDKYRRFALASADTEMLTRFDEYARSLGFSPRFGQHLSGGYWAEARHIPCLRLSQDRPARELEALISGGDSISFWRGYFSGIYDADGSTDGAYVRIAQSKPRQYERIARCLRALGLNFVEEEKALRLRGGRDALRKLLLETRPAVRRKVAPIFLALGGRNSYAVVEDVSYAGPSEIISIETSLGTYLSDGVLSRNCDSKFAVLPEYRDQWRRMSAEEVFAEVERLSGGCPILVTLSGGNPAIQPLGPLVRLGHERGYTFAIETQGTIHKDWFAELDYLTVSPKPPSSGMKTDWQRLSRCLEAAGKHTRTTLKVVVFDDADYEYAREVGRRYPQIPMYLQVGNEDFPGAEPGDVPEPDNARLLDSYEWLVDKVIEDGWNEATVLPQLHVLLWGNKRGV